MVAGSLQASGPPSGGPEEADGQPQRLLQDRSGCRHWNVRRRPRRLRICRPGAGDLGNIIGNPLETTYFLSRLIYDGTLDKFPGLKVCGAHAGGYLPSYIMRSDVACEVLNGANCLNKKRPKEYLWSQIMIDTMIFSDEGLGHPVNEMGASQIVYGTDNPLNWPVTWNSS